MANHDHGYKLLFSHASMVADLLRGFVHEDWVRQLDFSSLEKVSNSYVADDFRHRESDVVWRLRWGEGRWLYVYLLLEFQSTVDPFMAVRVLTYVGLLYQDLIRQGQTAAGGKLPPVFPLVLYNGNRPWEAAQEISELVEAVPGGLERYAPRLRYCLLDEGRIAASDLEPLRNLAAALFRLEKSRGPEDLERVVAAVAELLREASQGSLQRAFSEWLVQVLLPARMPGVDVPQTVKGLEEVKSMLAERVMEWTREWEQTGFEKGQEASLSKLRILLVHKLEERFGPLPEGARRRLEAIRSLENLAELIAQVPVASSLGEMGLA